MGREIRMVPKDWQHPEEDNGNYKPLFDETFEEAAKEWKNAFMDYEKNPESDCEYWEWNGGPPERDWYRLEYKGEANCFQMYETVSEGTPVSPVFETKEQLAAWLITQGYSEKAANGFVNSGYAPSMVMTGGKMYKNIEMHDIEVDNE